MGYPFVFGGSDDFASDGFSFYHQSFRGIEQTLSPNMASMGYHDQEGPSSASQGNTWSASASHQQSFPTQFTGNAPEQNHNHTPFRPTLAVPPGMGLPPVSGPRVASPISSIGPSRRGFSPLHETDSHYDSHYESHYDSAPKTPLDNRLQSPVVGTLLAPEPYSMAHAVQFTSMGPGFVKPSDVASGQHPEDFENDNRVIDFSSPTGYSLGNHPGPTAYQGLEPAQPAVPTGFSVQPVGPPLGFLAVKAEEEEEEEVVVVLTSVSHYPALHDEDDEDMASDEEQVHGKRQAPCDDDAADGEWHPSKRRKATRPRVQVRTAPARRRVKPAAAAAAAVPTRSRRGRASNPLPPLPAVPAHPVSSASTSGNMSMARPNCDPPSRPFHCAFKFAGCESVFAKKNEWKRHVFTKHLLLFYYPCFLCVVANGNDNTTTTNGPSIFNRKDLLTQHFRRMHVSQHIKHLLDASATTKPKKGTFKQAPSTPKSAGATQAQLNECKQVKDDLRALQSTAKHQRCDPPTALRCPVAGCPAQSFTNQDPSADADADVFDQWMEHIAKHMNGSLPGSTTTTRPASTTTSPFSPARRGAGPKSTHVNTKTTTNNREEGGDNYQSLIAWASRPDVGIIERRTDGRGEGWVLRTLLQRGPNGCAVATASSASALREEIVVGSGCGVLEEEEDAEGEEDDDV